MTASLPPSVFPPLTYRPVDPSSSKDCDILVAMRQACGWGVADVPASLANIAAGKEAMFLFLVEDEPAGMGGIIFEGKAPECTSRKDGRMMICESCSSSRVSSGQSLTLARPLSASVPLRSVPRESLRQLRQSFLHPLGDLARMAGTDGDLRLKYGCAFDPFQMMDVLERLCFETFNAAAITLTSRAFEPYTARSEEEADSSGIVRTWYVRRGYSDFQVRPLSFFHLSLSLKMFD